MLVLFTSVLSSATPKNIQINSVNNISDINQDPVPRTQDISDEDNFTGVGQSLSAVEYANSTNASQSLSPFDNTSYGLSYVNLPPQWSEYQLFASVSQLSDNRSWEINGNVDQQAPWTYSQSNANGEASGFWNLSVPFNPIGQRVLYLHNGYRPGQSVASTDFVAFSENTYVNRTAISAIKLSFSYWVNSSMYGLAQLFAQVNGYTRYFPAFESDSVNKTWVRQEFELTQQDISTYITTTPGSVVIKFGINATMNAGITTTDGYVFQNVYLDNISLQIRGLAKPTQIKLKCNGQSVSDSDFGVGNVSIFESNFNPSTIDFQAIKGNFSSNSSGVILTASLTVFANRTKFSMTSQDPDTTSGTTFWTSNNSISNWTAYYYAYTPFQYVGYNFSIAFPNSWTIWGAIDPNQDDILSQITVSSRNGLKYLEVNTINAESAGWWRLEFNSSNHITQLNTYGNSSVGPNNWVQKNLFLSGDYLNVTAMLTGATIGTKAQLLLRLPNGTLWVTQTRQASVVTGGSVTFTPIQFPSTNVPDYMVGDYEIFVSWNNSLAGSSFNETGFMTTTLSLRHQSKIIPDTPVFENLVQNDLIDIYVTFLDQESNIAITNGLLWFTNMTGQNQTLNMIKPGYYYAETQVTPFDLAGEVILTIHGNQTLYTESATGISLRYSILSSLVTNNSQLTVSWGNPFVFEVNFTELVTYEGISTAIIDTDWDTGYWSSQYKGNGNYTITGDSTPKSANHLYTLLVSIDAAGFIGQTMAFSVYILPREAVLSSVRINSVDVTLNKSIGIPVTSNLTFAVKWLDVENGNLVDEAAIQVVGIGSTPFTFTKIGEQYQCQISGTKLNLGTHYITVAATRSNFTDSTMALEIQINRIHVSYRTKENSDSYSIDVNTPFTLGIYVDNEDFGGTITSATVEYSGTDGSEGVLTDLGNAGYYSANLGTLKEGTYEFTIRVYFTDAIYEYKEYTISVNVAPVEGMPAWLLYLLIGALTGVMVGIFSYVFYFRFPPSVRQARALKRMVKKGGSREVVVKSLDTLLAEDYLNESQGLLPATTQAALRNHYIKEQKGAKATRTDSFTTNTPKDAKNPTEGGK